MYTIPKSLFMLREGRRVMTVYHQHVPLVIGFRNVHEVKKALFQVDARDSDRYFSIYVDEHLPRAPNLILVKKPCVQFGKLHLDTITLDAFFKYRDREPHPLLVIVEREIEDTPQYLLYETTILS